MVCTVDLTLLSSDYRGQMAATKQRAVECLDELSSGRCPSPELSSWFDGVQNFGFADQRRVEELIASLEISYDAVVLVGVGGSINGTRAVYEALKHRYQNVVDPLSCELYYAGDNLSEKAMIELLEALDERDPIVVAVSRSGSTLEPTAALRILESSLRRRYGSEAAKRIFVCTGDSGALLDLATKRSYPVLPFPAGVGGRYSVLSTVGSLPLALCGVDIQALLLGADRLFSELRADVDSDHPALVYARYQHAARLSGKSVEFLSYHEPKLAAFVEWWKQLFAESHGKQERGLLPVGFACSGDLHSLGQYLQQGPQHMVETFLQVKAPFHDGSRLDERRLTIPADCDFPEHLPKVVGRYLSDIDHAGMDSARCAHSERGIPCITLHIARIDPYHLGYLFAFFETACAISGIMLGVDPFDQPGVDVYKSKLEEHF